MKKFKNPIIKIKTFNLEDITTTSSKPSATQNAAQLLADEMSETATGGVSVIKWFS